MLGLAVRDPESAGLAGLSPVIILFFTSSALVPVATMPGWLQAFAKVRKARLISDSTSAKMALAPGQLASSSAGSWLAAATRMSARSLRVRTTVRSAWAWPGQGTATCSRWRRSRRYPAMTAASPASDLAPDSTSPSRQVLIAFGLTGTTG